jgi:hypothetical protein
MKHRTIDNIYITEYQSLTEFLSDITSRPNNKFFKNRTSSQTYESTSKSYKWYGTEDFAKASYMMTHGWDAAAQKMATKVKLTNSAATAVRSSKPSYGVVGSQASVPRYLQGIPTNMVSRQMTYAKQKVVTITKGIAYSSSWTPDEILAECTKALQIIQSMENGGQRVRLNVTWFITSNDNRCHTMCKVCVKQPDERLNLSKMAFALAHPSMLRRLFFKWLETDDYTQHDMGDYYGYPAYKSSEYAKIKDKVLEANEYYIPEEIKDMDELIKQLTSK